MAAYYMPYRYYTPSSTAYTISIIILLAGLVISAIAQLKVNSNFKKYQGVSSPFTGAEAARRLLESEGVYNVKIERTSGHLSDHFDPRTNVIRLSDGVYDSFSVAAVGIACHEAGHAIQYARKYAPIKIRNTILPITNIGSAAALPLVLLGLALSYYPLAILGVFFFGFTFVFQLVTLPVEFNASHRAINAIDRLSLFGNDNTKRNGAKKVLGAAATTYVAAMLVSLAQFLRLLAIVNSNRRRD